jgi:hypothetical protein
MSDRFTMTHHRPRFCARLLNLHRNHRSGMVTIEPIFSFDSCDRKVLTAYQSVQFRPAIPSGLDDHDA